MNFFFNNGGGGNRISYLLFRNSNYPKICRKSELGFHKSSTGRGAHRFMKVFHKIPVFFEGLLPYDIGSLGYWFPRTLVPLDISSLGHWFPRTLVP